MRHHSKFADFRQCRPGMAVALLLISLLPNPCPAQEIDAFAAAAAMENALVQAISRAEHSVVSIARVKKGSSPRQIDIKNAFNQRNPHDGLPGDDDLDGPLNPNFIPTDFGSGVIIGVDPANANHPRAYILTNYHVVKGGERTVPDDTRPDEYRLFIKFSDRNGAWAKIYAADPRSDLAIITIVDRDLLPVKLSELKPIKLGDGSRLKKGQLVIALGNSYASARDGSASASWGMVSNVLRRPAMPPRPLSEKQLETLHDLGDLIQVDTRLNLGTSGGALINLKGEMVGLTTSLAALAGFEKSSGFATPLDAGMLRTIQSLREGKEVEYGFLGISFSFDPFATQRRFPDVPNVPNGIFEYQVLPGGPAAQGGLQDGEMIVNINGERVYTPEDLTREINKHGPESRVRLTIWGRVDGASDGERYGTRIREVTLAKWGAHDEDSIIATNYRNPPWRGLVVDYPTARNKHNGEINPVNRRPNAYQFPKGVLVLKVLPSLDTKQADIVEGNRIQKVNDTPVTTPREFLEAVRSLRGNVVLHLENGKQVTIPDPEK